jgi:hypothetical protein
MEITTVARVYLCQGRQVVMVGSTGDRHGTVRDIHTGEAFSTYGYGLLPHIGYVEVILTYGTFKTTNRAQGDECTTN